MMSTSLLSRDVLRHHALASSPVDRLADARRRTDELFAIVHPDALYDRPIAERHRIVFYIGHLEAFDWNLLHDRELGLESFHPDFDRLFAFGIDPVGGGLPTDQPSEWPSMAAVLGYVEKCRTALDQAMLDRVMLGKELPAALSSIPPASGAHGFSFATLLEVAIEHRLMHAETLAYMLHQLPLDRKLPQPVPFDLASSPFVPGNVYIPAGRVSLGISRDSGAFGWDNEFESHTVNLPAFSMDRFKITNGEYLNFMEAGGYENRTLWDAQDWDWITEHKISHPAFWKRGDHSASSLDRSSLNRTWLYRTMFNDVSLPLAWPVYVSQAEAKAYANWVGKSLPTEAEWQRAAYCTPQGEQRPYPWGSESPSPGFGNFDFARWEPAPVNAHPAGKSAFGAEGMLGNGWEWTSSEFAPFPGFAAFPFYPGYSANFFDGKHFVMKGGSARTAACMLRSTFRNWFQAQYQPIYTGFRCVSR